MERLDELLYTLGTLPHGYISRKTIKGKVYTYLQYFHKGKILSFYVPAAELADVEAKLAQRKEIEKELKELSAGYVEMPPLTKREKNFTGYLMCGDKVAAKLYMGEATNIDENIAPLFFRKSKDANAYFANRVIDFRRANRKELLRALKIKDKDASVIPLYVNGRSLTDNFWFRPSGAVTKYSELRFGKNLYAGVAYDGLRREYPVGPARTPEISTPGETEKCWRFENKSWWMYKKETPDEVFIDNFVGNIARELEIFTIRYARTEDGVKTRNFAEKFNFEPFFGIVDKADDYAGIFEFLKPYGKEMLKDFIRLLYLDAITSNYDRTLNDMGVLRNKQTGQVFRLAPNFDNNRCMKDLSLKAVNDLKVRAFLKFIKSNKLVKKLYKQCKIRKLKKDMFKKLVLRADPQRKDFKVYRDFVMERVEFIKKYKFKALPAMTVAETEEAIEEPVVAPVVEEEVIEEAPITEEVVEEAAVEEAVAEEAPVEEATEEQPIEEEPVVEEVAPEEEAPAEEPAPVEEAVEDSEEESVEDFVDEGMEIVETKVNAEGETIVIEKDKEGHFFEIRFSKSFQAKLIQASDESKAYYEGLKNEVLSYKKTKSVVTWSFDSINAGRNPVLKFAVRGKTLCVYFPLNADDYADSKYKLEKITSKKYAAVPALYRIKSDRRFEYAKELIAIVAEALGLEKGDEQKESYVLPYEDNKALLAKGLIREVKVKINRTEEAAPVEEAPIEEPAPVVEEPVVEEAPVEEPVAEEPAPVEEASDESEEENIAEFVDEGMEVVETKVNAEGETIVVEKDKEGNIFEIRFSKSFQAKLIQASDESKAYYEGLKNEALSYKKSKSVVTWSFDSINAGRSPVAKFTVRGKTLCVYLPLNADDYADSKYKLEKITSKKYAAVPALYRIKSDRRFEYAKELIAEVNKNLGFEKVSEEKESYVLPYEDNKALLEKGLIREVKVKVGSKPDDAAPVEEAVDVAAAVAEEPAAEPAPVEETPVEEEPVAEEAPVVEEQPVEEPADEVAPEEEVPTEEMAAEEPVDEVTEDVPAENAVEEPVEEEPVADKVTEEPVEEEPAPEEAPVEEDVEDAPAEEEKAEEKPKKKGLFGRLFGKKDKKDKKGKAVEEEPAPVEEAPVEDETEPEDVPAEEPNQELAPEGEPAVEEEPVADEATEEEAPADDAPVADEAPVEDAAEEEAPVEEPVEEPVAEEEPVADEVNEEVPAEEVADEQPVEEPSEEVVEEAPVEDQPVEDVPAEEPATEENDVEEVPVEDAPIEDNAEPEAVEDSPVEEEPVAEEAQVEESAHEEVVEEPVEEDVPAEENVEAKEAPADEAAPEEVPGEEPVAEEVADEANEEVAAEDAAEEPVEEVAPEEDVEDAPAEEEKAEEAPKKKGLFGRLFGKKK